MLIVFGFFACFYIEGYVLLPTDDIAVKNSKMKTTSSCICLNASHLRTLRLSYSTSLSNFPRDFFFEIVNSVHKD